MSKLHFFKKNYFLILILIFFATILFKNLDKPFIGHHDYNAVWHATAARNQDRYGPLKTKFASLMTNDNVNIQNSSFYTHYPPLVPIFLYLSFELFGISHWSVRIVPAIAALATIYLIYKTGAKFMGLKVGLLAAALSAVVPMLVYFARIPTHDLFALPFILLSINFYFDFFHKSDRKNFLKLLASLILAHLTHWTGYYLTPLFFLHFLIFSKNKKKLALACFFPLLSISMFTVHLAHTVWLTGTPLGGGMVEIFLGRLNLKDQPEGYSTFNFLKLQVRYLVVYYTRPLLLLSALATFWVLLQAYSRKITDKVALLVMLGIFGATHALVFRNISFIHDYIIISMLPAITLGASFAFFFIQEKLKIKSKIITFALCLLLVALVASERLAFTKALIATSSFKEGVELGEFIHYQTKSGQKVLILSPDFKSYFEVFTAYYADRQIDYGLPSSLELTELLESHKYEMVIAMPDRDTPPSLVEILQSKRDGIKINKSIIYEI